MHLNQNLTLIPDPPGESVSSSDGTDCDRGDGASDSDEEVGISLDLQGNKGGLRWLFSMSMSQP